MKKIALAMCALCASVSLCAASPFQSAIDRAHRDGLYHVYVKQLAATSTKVVSYDELVKAAQGYQVVVIGGYSGLGYAYPDKVRQDLEMLVRTVGDHALYVLGATSDGIGQAYKDIPAIADMLGYHDIKMAGIVSRNAAQWGIEPQDYVVFVDTAVDDWAVVVDGKSLYIKIASDTNGIVVYFRGGGTSKGELEEALADGLPVFLVVDNTSIPNKANVEKRLSRNPNYVVDGTVDIVKNAKKWKNLIVIQ